MPPKRTSKKNRTFALRCSDEELEILHKSAKDTGENISDYARKRLLGQDNNAPYSGNVVSSPGGAPLQVDPPPDHLVLTHWHVDDLGEDNLRLENGAMTR